ncbi:protein containing Pyruvate kinase [Candidatus Magnetobacterium bavaricum]|uniref:Protein containing Pyruvate kinase n=1 Tax=Candidatus Magnetobacterium bavaricum TaxID=29290 RepID=A0A0F3GVC2_9BACT|nr:protein containing Pyruvate kinase [Candidatus Magnetobacterium bavaricum]
MAKETMERQIVYFETPGKANTSSCLQIAQRAIGQYGYKYLIVASTTGETGVAFSEAFKGADTRVVVVTHSYGFREANTIELTAESADAIRQNGAMLYTGTMVTHSLETALSAKSGGMYPAMIVAQALRRFGEGPKVCCEMVMMVADAGLVPEGSEVVVVAGTGKGADTVMVVRAAASKRFLDLKVLEILAKPRG